MGAVGRRCRSAVRAVQCAVPPSAAGLGAGEPDRLFLRVTVPVPAVPAVTVHFRLGTDCDSVVEIQDLCLLYCIGVLCQHQSAFGLWLILTPAGFGVLSGQSPITLPSRGSRCAPQPCPRAACWLLSEAGWGVSGAVLLTCGGNIANAVN